MIYRSVDEFGAAEAPRFNTRQPNSIRIHRLAGGVLDFRSETAGAPLRAAAFKFDGSECFIWHWLESMRGARFHWDLCDDGRRHAFREVHDAHASYHEDGRWHTRIDGMDFDGSLLPAQRVEKRQGTAIAAISSWLSLRRLNIPLDGAFPPLTFGPTSPTPIILRAVEYGSSGVALTAYLCRESSVDELVRTRSFIHCWQIGAGSLRLVVFADLAP